MLARESWFPTFSALAKFPDSPDFSFITPKAGVDQTAPDLSNFGARLTGWVQPDVTGSYRFFLRSDDGSELYVNGTAGGEPPDPLVDNPAAVGEIPVAGLSRNLEIRA
jgi:hypothetical protein